MCGRRTYERKERFTSQLSDKSESSFDCRTSHHPAVEGRLVAPRRFRAVRVLGGKRLTLQWFAVRLGRRVVELRELGELRGGFEQSDLGAEGKSPNTKQ